MSRKITLDITGGSSKQYSSLLLELNLVKQAWKSYGVDMQISAPGLKSALTWGKSTNDKTKTD